MQRSYTNNKNFNFNIVFKNFALLLRGLKHRNNFALWYIMKQKKPLYYIKATYKFEKFIIYLHSDNCITTQKIPSFIMIVPYYVCFCCLELVEN